jgi:hypothetical protein
MTQLKLENINIGNSPNNGIGDSPRDAMKKINSNFEILSRILELNFKKIIDKFNENSTN